MKTSVRERPFFSTDFKIRTTFRLGWVGGLRPDGCSDFKMCFILLVQISGVDGWVSRNANIVQILKSVGKNGRSLSSPKINGMCYLSTFCFGFFVFISFSGFVVVFFSEQFVASFTPVHSFSKNLEC